ncbi:hypothetical protein AAG570_001607 [Ranatra chinensis]|uniref:Neugrin n=1 Tax=Ranatra chinensis TaxID=642074 RepID=A0ABD0Y910_9HEMI
MNEAVMLGWRRFFHLQKCVLQARHRRGVVRGDVGIQGRLKVVKTSSPDLNEIDEEILENLEPDFVNQKFSQEFDREMSRMKKTVDYSRVERKHFKSPTNPNMLTWAEKEQIRLLHQEQPEVWTVEKLSKSYPATKNIIQVRAHIDLFQKIIMSRWRPRNEERIAKHDRSVLANWKSLREGKLSVPDEEFERHLKNFTTRENLLPPAQGELEATH